MNLSDKGTPLVVAIPSDSPVAMKGISYAIVHGSQIWVGGWGATPTGIINKIWLPGLVTGKASGSFRGRTVLHGKTDLSPITTM